MIGGDWDLGAIRNGPWYTEDMAKNFLWIELLLESPYFQIVVSGGEFGMGIILKDIYMYMWSILQLSEYSAGHALLWRQSEHDYSITQKYSAIFN